MGHAKTIDTQGKLRLTCEVGGMYLGAGDKRANSLRYLTLLLGPMAYEGRGYHHGVASLSSPYLMTSKPCPSTVSKKILPPAKN